MRRSALLLVAAAAGLVLFVATLESQAGVGAKTQIEPGRRDIFSENDHLLIDRAIAGGVETGTILIAAKDGRLQAAKQNVKALGGSVKYEAAELGYLRVRIRLDRLARLDAANIQVADFAAPDQFGPSYDTSALRPLGGSLRAPSQDSTANTPMPTFALPSGTGESNDFSGTKDVGQPHFLGAHPTFDGRGVRVGMEEGPDLFSPFLQHSRNLSGRVVPKILDYFTVLRPHDPSLQGQTNNRIFGWVDMRATVTVTGKTFEFNGHRFIAPGNGLYHVGSYRIDYPTMSEWYRNVAHPQGTTCESAGSFTVLWDQRSDTVWVNSDQDCSLADDKPMHTYAVHHDVGALPVGLNWAIYGEHFPPGMKPPARYPFIVQTDRNDGFVWIGLGEGSHADGVATSIAGDRLFGVYDGMAPNAQLVVALGDFAAYYQGLEGMIALARYPVNIITLQEGTSFAGNEERNVWDVVLSRVAEHYHVAFTISASNDGPTIDNVETPADASGVFGIGAYTTKERLRANFSAVVPHEDYVTDYSSRGPGGFGGFKPDFLAPSETLIGTSTTEPPAKIAKTHLLPIGYQVFGGTSQAAPMAAGSLALLISAAKQSNIPYDPLRLRQAILSTARYLQRYQPLDQGAGLINVPAAWLALQKLATVAPVSDISNNPGFYEREGWSAAARGERTLAFAFTASSDMPLEMPVRWVGNDGTFTTDSGVRPAPDGTATLNVTIHPTNTGVHSANLQVLDPRTGLVITSRMCAIVAAEPLEARNHFSVDHEVMVEHPGYARFFVDVPSSAGALVVRVTASPRSLQTVSNPVTSLYLVQVRTPDVQSTAEDSLYAWVHDGGVWQHAYPHPRPGVWEITLNINNPSSLYSDPHQRAPLPAASFSLHVASFATAGLTQTGGKTSELHLSLNNSMNGFHARTGVSPLGSRYATEVLLTAKQPRRLFTIDVPANTTEVRAQIGSPFPRDAQVNVYLYACATDVAAKKDFGASYEVFYQGNCEFRSSADIVGGGIASTAFPTQWLVARGALPAGRWVAVVELAPSTPRVTLHYSDVVVNPMYGTSTVKPEAAFYKSGARWNQKLRIALGVTPPRGRTVVALPSIPADETATVWAAYDFKNIDWDGLAKEHPAVRRAYESVFSQGVLLATPR